MNDNQVANLSPQTRRVVFGSLPPSHSTGACSQPAQRLVANQANQELDFLQIPLDPNEYHHVCMIWRGLVFFFLGLAFGLRHSGLQGQRLTDAVSWIHRRRGLETPDESMFNVVNYSDDLGGVEETKVRAFES